MYYNGNSENKNILFWYDIEKAVYVFLKKKKPIRKKFKNWGYRKKIFFAAADEWFHVEDIKATDVSCFAFLIKASRKNVEN